MMEQHSAFYSIVWEYQYNQGCVLFPKLLKLWNELLKWQISLFFGANASNQENGWIFLVFSFIYGLPQTQKTQIYSLSARQRWFSGESADIVLPLVRFCCPEITNSLCTILENCTGYLFVCAEDVKKHYLTLSLSSHEVLQHLYLCQGLKMELTAKKCDFGWFQILLLFLFCRFHKFALQYLLQCITVKLCILIHSLLIQLECFEMFRWEGQQKHVLKCHI